MLLSPDNFKLNLHLIPLIGLAYEIYGNEKPDYSKFIGRLFMKHREKWVEKAKKLLDIIQDSSNINGQLYALDLGDEGLNFMHCWYFNTFLSSDNILNETNSSGVEFMTKLKEKNYKIPSQLKLAWTTSKQFETPNSMYESKNFDEFQDIYAEAGTESNVNSQESLWQATANVVTARNSLVDDDDDHGVSNRMGLFRFMKYTFYFFVILFAIYFTGLMLYILLVLEPTKGGHVFLGTVTIEEDFMEKTIEQYCIIPSYFAWNLKNDPDADPFCARPTLSFNDSITGYHELINSLNSFPLFMQGNDD